LIDTGNLDNSSRQNNYRVYASNLQRAPQPGRVLGSASFHIPAFDLHLVCAWLRDDRDHERLGMPRARVETPNGKFHLKPLARWGSSQSEELFQRAGLRALHELLAKTEPDPMGATTRDRYAARPRLQPLAAANSTLGSPATTNAKGDA
jgi:hypothetical protein